MSVAAEYEARCGEDSDIALHLPRLYAEVAGRCSPVVIELGVREGNSTSALLAGVEVSAGELWSVDSDPYINPGGFPWAGNPRWHYIGGDDLSPEVLARLPARCDVLLVDTLHTYGQAMAELDAYAPRVAPGGVILMHDTQLLGEGVGGLDAGDPSGPVADAIRDYCASAGMGWENCPGSFGLGVIRT